MLAAIILSDDPQSQIEADHLRKRSRLIIDDPVWGNVGFPVDTK